MEITNQREIYIYIYIWIQWQIHGDTTGLYIYICVDTGVYKWDKNL